MAEGPLAGKRVVVTRAAEQAASLATELERLGATVLLLPVLSYEGPQDPEPLDAALRRIADFDWLLVTSQNVVRFVEPGLARMGVDRTSLPRVAAVGSATAETARAAGWPVEFVSSRFQGVALAEELGERVRGCRVLLPRSDRARGDLPEALRRAGAEVTQIVAYRTVAMDLRTSKVGEEIRNGRADVITFASPSAFHAFCDALGPEEVQRLAAFTALAAIGPVTAEAIRAAGLPVQVQAEESTTGGLAQAIAEYFERQRATQGA